MRLWLAKQGNRLVPTDEESTRWISRLGDGECVEFEARLPRSVRWHRMYFAMCREIGQNQDPPRDESSIDAEIRVRAGHFDVLLFDGLEVRIPKRIAFSEMDADAWQAYWERAELAIAETFGPEYIREMAVA